MICESWARVPESQRNLAGSESLHVVANTSYAARPRSGWRISADDPRWTESVLDYCVLFPYLYSY